MQELTLEQIQQKAGEIHASSHGHVHTLKPGCIFSELKSQYAILLEDTGSGEVFVYYSDVSIEALAKPIAVLLNGADTVPSDEAAPGERAATPAVAEMLNRMRDGKGHPHVLRTDCLLNDTPGSWRIIFEDSTTGEVLTSVHAERPLQDIRAIEALVYA